MIILMVVFVFTDLAGGTDESWILKASASGNSNPQVHKKEAEFGTDAIQTNPKYQHFFNGSYEVHDVLMEFLNNKSLTNITNSKK